MLLRGRSIVLYVIDMGVSQTQAVLQVQAYRLTCMQDWQCENAGF